MFSYLKNLLWADENPCDLPWYKRSDYSQFSCSSNHFWKFLSEPNKLEKLKEGISTYFNPTNMWGAMKNPCDAPWYYQDESTRNSCYYQKLWNYLSESVSEIPSSYFVVGAGIAIGLTGYLYYKSQEREAQTEKATPSNSSSLSRTR